MNPGQELQLLRILDANANRAAEALRSIEEYARFVLDDRHLTEGYKSLRHDLTSCLKSVLSHRTWAARDTLHDVGTVVATDQEHERVDLNAVLQANLKRLEQSLRCLEEYGKAFDQRLGPSIESSRYRAYTLAKAIESTRDSLQRLEKARLYVLLDGRSDQAEFEQVATQLILAGADVIQLRDKRLSDGDLMERARALRNLTRRTSTLFIVNDRPDLALLAAADGVHVGQEELTVRDVRSVVGVDALVGVSTHNLAQARQAVLDGANYLGCGPTFPSSTKTFSHFPGLQFLRQVAGEIRLPCFAIGGISPTNLPEVVKTGMRRVAVGAAVCHASDPAAAIARLRGALPNRESSAEG